MVELPGARLPRAGDTVGPFRIQRELARGGLGAVFEATGPGGDRVALKVLLEPDRGDGGERFRREAQVGMTLRHPGLCPVLQFGEHQGLAYLTMPLLEGALPVTEFAQGRGDRETLELMLQVAEGLGALHEAGSLHRDLKPSNVLVTPDGVARIVDFGLVKPLERSALTEPGQVMGTPHYMSPELVQGRAAEVDERSDIFSFGVLLHEVLSGQRPFAGETTVSVMQSIVSGRPAPLAPHLPDELRGAADVVRVCLAKNPSARYSVAADLVADLRAVLAGEPLSPLARRRGGRLLAVLGVGALLLALTLGLHVSRGTPGAAAGPGATRLAKEAARWLRSREAISPPPQGWAATLDGLTGTEPEARAARIRGRTALGLTALGQGDLAGARAQLEALTGESDPLVNVLRGALIEAEGGEAPVALANLEEIEAAGVRRPEVRGWRARARVRAGALTRDQASAVLADLEAVARVRPLAPAEARAQGSALLAQGKVQAAADALGSAGVLPSDLRSALVLAQVAMDLRHGAPAQALTRLEGVELVGEEELRESLRAGCVRRAQATLKLYRGGVEPAERDRMLDELRVARAVRPDTPLPRAVTHGLLEIGRDAERPDFVVAVSLVDLAPEDVEVQRAVGLLAVYANELERTYRARFLVAARRALDRLPPGDPWEEVAVVRVRALYFEERYEEAVREALEVLPRTRGKIARRQINTDLLSGLLNLEQFVDAKARANAALEEDPDTYTYNYFRAQALVGLGRRDETYPDALRFALSGYEAGTGRQHTALALCWDLRRADALAELRPAFESFLRENQSHPGWFVRAAVIQLDGGDRQRAAESLEAASKGFEEGDAALRRLAAPCRALALSLRGVSGGSTPQALVSELGRMAAELDQLRGEGRVP